MKKKILAVLVIALLSVTAVVSQQLQIFNVPAISSAPYDIQFNVQIWDGSNPATVANAGFFHIGPVSAYSFSDIYFTMPTGYKIYSIRIYDNSGGGNNATVGDPTVFTTTDDFGYYNGSTPQTLYGVYVEQATPAPRLIFTP